MGSIMLFAFLFCTSLAWAQAGNSSLVTNEQLNELKGKFVRLDTLLSGVKDPGQHSPPPQNPPVDRKRRQVEEIFIDDERLNFMRPDQITEHIYMSPDKRTRAVENEEAIHNQLGRKKRCAGGQTGRPIGIPPPGWRPRTTTRAPTG